MSLTLEEKIARRGENVSDQAVCELALYAGHILLESGAELFRVEDTIRRINDAYGIESDNAFVLSNGIFLNRRFRPGGAVRPGGTYPDCLLPPRPGGGGQPAFPGNSRRGGTPSPRPGPSSKASRRAPKRKTSSGCWPPASGSGAFCVLFGGTAGDALAALLTGLLLYLVILYPLRRPMSKIVQNLLCGAFVAGCAVGFTRLGLGGKPRRGHRRVDCPRWCRGWPLPPASGTSATRTTSPAPSGCWTRC